MKYVILVIVLFVIASCHTKNNKDDVSNSDTITDYDTSAVDPAEKVSTCYENISNEDTISMSLFNTSEVITGSLQYHFHEKDNNKGTLQGNMLGDTLFADYIFMSEGKASVREVAFLKQGDDFIEGFSEMQEINKKMVFINTADLKFTGNPLHKIDCTINE